MRLFFLNIFLFTLFSTALQAQLNDDFSDGDFTSNPAWTGDVSEFKVNSSNKLQLNSSGTDTAYLCTANSLMSGAEWSFYIKQSFNSSANNHSRIYLVSDAQNLKGPLHGYFVRFGSSQDDICLFRQDGLTLTKIIQGTHGNTGASTNSFTIKVKRDTLGNWELFSDATASTAFVSEGTAFDTSYSTTNWFGIFCKHTSSNSTKFYFDDFLIQKIQIDTFPPFVSSLKVLSDSSLHLLFSEAVDTASATDADNYLVDNAIGKPLKAVVDAQNPALVHLFFQNHFVLAKQYTLTVGNVKDLNNNVMKQASISFFYYIPREFDVLFNEIMADPSPVVGLPDAEYLELYNRSPFDINLKNWQLTTGTKKSIFPDSTIKSGEYVILCRDADAGYFSSFSKVIGLSSFSLTNSGGQIILKDDKGGIIHFVNYSDKWYGQSSKADGGWSLEQIDPQNPCGCRSNWWASDDAKGGTPGKINSVNAANKDMQAPEISRVAVDDSKHITVYFSEPMDSASVLKPAAYMMYDSLGYALAASSYPPDYSSVTLETPKPLKARTVYKLQIKDSLFDCVGNALMLNTTVPFGMAETPLRNDLVINEVLFNPRDNGVDFVEVYNRSKKIIDLKDLRLSNYSEDLQDYENIKKISDESIPLFPGEYYVLTTDPDIVKKQYKTTAPDNFATMESLPSMPNNSGNIYLITSSLNCIDSLWYDESMHYALLSDYEGVSLERIDYDKPSSPDNWHSAAEAAGFATPAYRNSQYSTSENPPAQFSISPEIFSPDNDGYNDVMTLSYDLPSGTAISKVMIFNSAGQLVKTLSGLYTAGTTGSLRWDGTTDNNGKAPVGIYVVFIQTLDLNGNVRNYKLSVTVGAKL